jgi:hypothetical protein
MVGYSVCWLIALAHVYVSKFCPPWSVRPPNPFHFPSGTNISRPYSSTSFAIATLWA